MRREQSRNEQGSALVMALVMLTVIGLIVGAALTYSSTSLRASNNAIRPNRASLYAADSAIQGAIEFVRDHPQAGTEIVPGACNPNGFLYNDPQGGNVEVEICPQHDSLFPPTDRAVLLTLGTDPREGSPGEERHGGSQRNGSNQG